MKHNVRDTVRLRGDRTAWEINDKQPRLCLTMARMHEAVVKPKFHLARHISKRQDSTRSTCRVV